MTQTQSIQATTRVLLSTASLGRLEEVATKLLGEPLQAPTKALAPLQLKKLLGEGGSGCSRTKRQLGSVGSRRRNTSSVWRTGWLYRRIRLLKNQEAARECR